MNGLAAGGRPGSIHQVGAAYAGRERETASERLAQTNEVGDDRGMFAREPFAGAAEACVNLIQNKERLVLVTEPAQYRQDDRAATNA